MLGRRVKVHGLTYARSEDVETIAAAIGKPNVGALAAKLK